MRGHTDRFGLEVLDEDECFNLLGSKEIGRLAVVSGGVPIIFPVNYAVDGRSVLIRTAPGTKLTAARRRQITLEVDDTDAGERIGWSVLLRGRAELVTELDPATSDRLRRVPLHPWAGEKPVWVRIVPVVVSGRRLAADADLNPSGTEEPLKVEAVWPVTIEDADFRLLGSAVVRVDDRHGRLRGRRNVGLAMVGADGGRLALASFDGSLTAEAVDVTIVVQPDDPGDGVGAAALLVRRLVVLANMEGAQRLVVDFDPRRAEIPAVLTATGYPWSIRNQADTARAQLDLPIELA